MSTMDFHEMLLAAKKNAKLQIGSSSSGLPSTSQGNTDISNNSKIRAITTTAIQTGLLFATQYLHPDYCTYLVQEFEKFSDWNQVGGRQVALFGGVPHPSGAICEPLPAWLNPISQLLKPYFGDHAPDQVLLNKYQPGQGINFHNDGPLYEPTAAILSFHADDVIRFREKTPSTTAIAATVTLSSSSSSSSAASADDIHIFLPKNSLLVFSHLAYTDYVHGIVPVGLRGQSPLNICDCVNSNLLHDDNHNNDEDHQVLIPARSQIRYSLTFRRLKHVSKPADEFGPCSAEERAETLRRKLWWLKSISDA